MKPKKFETALQKWCREIRERYELTFNVKPDGIPNMGKLDGDIQERMCRVGIEARHFQVDDNQDDLAIIAYHTILLEAIKRGMKCSTT